VGRASKLATTAALCLGLARSLRDGAVLLEIAKSDAHGSDLRAACALSAGLVRMRGSGKVLGTLVEQEDDPLVLSYAAIGLGLIGGESASESLASRLSKEDRPEVRRRFMTALGYAGDADSIALLVPALGDSYLVNREAAAALFMADPVSACDALLLRLGDGKNVFARRFAVLALGAGLDRRRPSWFADSLLAAGLPLHHPLGRLLLWLESEALYTAHAR
jgi:HEAT repeat protein